MAKKEEEKKAAAQQQGNEDDVLRKNNILADNAIDAAIEEMNKEKSDQQKRDAKVAFCAITYYNQKARAELRKRRREDDIQKEKLDASKKIFERFIGFECEIQKDGKLKKTDKKVADGDRLTAVEVRQEKDKLNEEIRKKIQESDRLYSKDISELRGSYEGQYRWYSDWD